MQIDKKLGVVRVFESEIRVDLMKSYGAFYFIRHGDENIGQMTKDEKGRVNAFWDFLDDPKRCFETKGRNLKQAFYKVQSVAKELNIPIDVYYNL